MHLDDEDAGLLKKWVVKKIEDLSDADSDVLADYVLALIRSDDPEPVAKAGCVENLKDFLNDDAERFVNEVFAVIANKSYDPSRPAPKPPTDHHQIPNRPDFVQQGEPKNSRKRGYRDWDDDGSGNGRSVELDGGDRPMKQLRRGGRNNDQRGGRQQHMGVRPSWPQSNNLQGSHGQQFPSGVPPFDPSDPWSMLQALNQMFGFMAGSQPGTANTSSSSPPRQRCRDYDTRGFCMAGTSCPFEHGEMPYVVPPVAEYDPVNAGLTIGPSSDARFQGRSDKHSRGAERRRGRGGPKSRGVSGRSEFASHKQSRKPTGTAVVVEAIPNDKCNEESLRETFAEFGQIQEVTIESQKRRAVVKYVDHDSAQAAHDSPKSIFDNRFVKVYWHRERRHGEANGFDASLPRKPVILDVEMQKTDEIDHIEIAKRLEEAQRKHEESKQMREEAEKQRQDLDSKLRAMEAERKTISEALARKTGQAGADSTGKNGDSDNEKTRALKEQLAKLEAEAKSLGIDPDAPSANGSFSNPSYRGRGGHRGRGRAGHWGSWTGGRGNPTGSVMRLDNRPKTIAVVFTDAGASFGTHGEKMGQFMLFNSLPYASIAKHPDRNDAALVDFAQRFEAEIAMGAAREGQDLPYIGHVKLSWHKPAAINGTTSDAGLVQTAAPTNGQRHEEDTSAISAPCDSDAHEMGDEQNLDHY